MVLICKVIVVGGYKVGWEFMRKLKYLKRKLKSWNKEEFGNVGLRKVEILEQMKDLDKFAIE